MYYTVPLPSWFGERFAKYIPKTRIALWRGNIQLQKIMYFVKLRPISYGHLKEPDLKYICTCIGHQTNRRTNLIQTHEPSMSSLLPPFIIEIHVHKCLSYVTRKSRFAIWLSCIIICNKIQKWYTKVHRLYSGFLGGEGCRLYAVVSKRPVKQSYPSAWRGRFLWMPSLLRNTYTWVSLKIKPLYFHANRKGHTGN